MYTNFINNLSQKSLFKKCFKSTKKILPKSSVNNLKVENETKRKTNQPEYLLMRCTSRQQEKEEEEEGKIMLRIPKIHRIRHLKSQNKKPIIIEENNRTQNFLKSETQY